MAGATWGFTAADLRALYRQAWLQRVLDPRAGLDGGGPGGQLPPAWTAARSRVRPLGMGPFEPGVPVTPWDRFVGYPEQRATVSRLIKALVRTAGAGAGCLKVRGAG